MPTAEARAPGDRPGGALTTSVEELNAASIVHVAGEVDISTVGELEAAIDLAESRSLSTGGSDNKDRLGRLIVIDLRGVTFLGAEGLRSLVSAQNRVAGGGGTMRVVAPASGGIIRRLLDLSGVGALLDLFESIESAVPSSDPG